VETSQCSGNDNDQL